MAKAKKAKSMKRVKRSVKKAVKPKMKKMPKAELKIYRTLLVKEREKVGGGLSHIAETTLNKSQRDASGDLSGYSFHMADQASDDYERDFALGRATDEQKILYAIDEAMKRIGDGSYGNCLQCGKVIPKKRLKALPYTELCIECQKTRENK
ncbi:MAG: TraR/DksA C4-type zinc finger protein [Candidatus Omnitrophota bacterium]